jgi:hypothetical protein
VKTSKNKRRISMKKKLMVKVVLLLILAFGAITLPSGCYFGGHGGGGHHGHR